MISWSQKVLECKAYYTEVERIYSSPVKRERWYSSIKAQGLSPSVYNGPLFSWSLPVPIPAYLVKKADFNARKTLSFLRWQLEEKKDEIVKKKLTEFHPQKKLISWLTDHFSQYAPHLAFDSLITLTDSEGEQINTRQLGYEEVKKMVLAGKAILDIVPLELQTADCYQLGMFRQSAIPLAQSIYDISYNQSWLATSRYGDDYEKETQYLLETQYKNGLFLEYKPETQVTYANLKLLANNKIQNIASLEHMSTLKGTFISRLVHSDYKEWTESATNAEKKQFIALINDPKSWISPNFHPFCFYWGTKETLRDILSTEFAKDTNFLKGIVLNDKTSLQEIEKLDLENSTLKPVLGQSAMGVVVSPTRQFVESLLSSHAEEYLLQPIIHPVRILPIPLTLRGKDRDADLGVSVELRLMYSSGTPFKKDGELTSLMTRTAFTSADPARKIQNDSKKRGWFTNLGCTLLVLQNELGIDVSHVYDHGLGCGLGYVID